MERNMEFFIECIDDLSLEQQKLENIFDWSVFYSSSNSTIIACPCQQAQQQAWLEERRYDLFFVFGLVLVFK